MSKKQNQRLEVGQVVKLKLNKESEYDHAKIIEFDPYYVTFKGRKGPKGRFSRSGIKWSRRKLYRNRADLPPLSA